MTTVITSLNPNIRRLDAQGNDFGVEYQRQCLESWMDAGARVVSLNAENEIERLNQLEYRATFVPVEVSPFRPGGRALPSIADAIKFAARLQDDVVLITNSDILFRSDKQYLEHVAGLVGREDFLIANRIDIEDVQKKSGSVYADGYDVFAFHPSKAWKLDLRGFNFGSPWWDYWIPVNALFEGLNLKWLDSQYFHHVKHDQAWDWSEWNIGCGLMISKIKSQLDYSEPLRTPRDFCLGFSKLLFSMATNESYEKEALTSTGPFALGSQMGSFVRLVLEWNVQKLR
jgi:hypothetical protein